MSNYPDDNDRDRDRDDSDRYDRDDHDNRGGRGGEGNADHIAAARAATPGLFLILNGLFGLVCVVLLSIPMVFQPELIIKFVRDMAANQPQGQQRQDMEKQMDDAEKELQQNRGATQIQNGIELAILALGNILAILGGVSMRSVGSYGLSLTGSIASIIPLLTGCCCTGIPFGIWGLIVLMKPEVKAGFAAKRRSGSNPDAY